MSKKPSKYSALLNGNQSPASPAELDSKILQYAETHKPESRTRAPWTSILATISVVGIAVLITVQPPKISEFDQGISREFDTMSSRIEKGVEDGIKKEFEESIESPVKKTAITTAVTTQKTSKRFLDKRSEADTLRMKGVAEDKAFSYQSARAPAAAMVDAPKKRETLQTTSLMTARKKDDLQDVLKNLNKLLVNGHREKAYSEYHQLRKSCLDCKLPDTLEMALEQISK